MHCAERAARVDIQPCCSPLQLEVVLLTGCLFFQDQEAQVARKKRRTATRSQARSIAGASLEVRAQHDIDNARA